VGLDRAIGMEARAAGDLHADADFRRAYEAFAARQKPRLRRRLGFMDRFAH